MILPQEGLVNLFGGEGCSQGQISPSYPLCHAHEVRGHPLVLTGEHPARAAKACGHLIGDHQNPVLGAELPHPPEEPRGMHDHPRRPLDHGFDDQGGTFPVMSLQGLLQSPQAGEPTSRVPEPLRTAVTIGGLYPVCGEKQGGEDPMEEVYSPHAYRPEGIPVVGVLKGDEAGALPLALVLPVLESHLQGHLHGGRPVVGVKDPSEPFRGDLHEPLRQLDGWRIGEAEEGRVGDPLQLLPYGPVNRGMAVTVDVHPEGRDPIYVPASVDIHEIDPLGPFDDEGFLGLIVLHLGEGVPEVTFVPFLKPSLPFHWASFQISLNSSPTWRKASRASSIS